MLGHPADDGAFERHRADDGQRDLQGASRLKASVGEQPMEADGHAVTDDEVAADGEEQHGNRGQGAADRLRHDVGEREHRAEDDGAGDDLTERGAADLLPRGNERELGRMRNRVGFANRRVRVSLCLHAGTPRSGGLCCDTPPRSRAVQRSRDKTQRTESIIAGVGAGGVGWNRRSDIILIGSPLERCAGSVPALLLPRLPRSVKGMVIVCEHRGDSSLTEPCPNLAPAEKRRKTITGRDRGRKGDVP